VRGPQDAPLNALLVALLAEGQEIATRRGLTFDAEKFYSIDATTCDSNVQQRFNRSVTALQGESLMLPSGAGHDAIAIAEVWPVAMLFVRCKDGISHHPDESVTVDDVAMATQAYIDTVLSFAH